MTTTDRRATPHPPSTLRPPNDADDSDDSGDSGDLDDLLASIAHHDERAWPRFYGLSIGPLTDAAMGVLCNRAMAEEVAHEVLLGLWIRPEVFDPNRGCATTFLRTIAVRRAIDQVRAHVRAQARDERDRQETNRLTDGDLVERVDLQLHADRLRRELAELPDRQREAIVLSFYCGMSHSQIARATRTPLGTVKTRIRAGLRSLGAALAAPALTTG